MSTISVTNINDGDAVTAASVNNQVNTIVNDYNGNITDANISASASIAANKIAGGVSGMFGAWTSWTPTLVNAALGNGTFTCKYIQFGKTVFFEFVFLLGSTSTVGTAPTFTLPVTSAATPSTTFPIARGHIDNTSGQFNAYAAWTTTTTATMRYWDTNNNGAGITATAPGTFATGWTIVYAGEYQAA